MAGAHDTVGTRRAIIFLLCAAAALAWPDLGGALGRTQKALSGMRDAVADSAAAAAAEGGALGRAQKALSGVRDAVSSSAAAAAAEGGALGRARQALTGAREAATESAAVAAGALRASAALAAWAAAHGSDAVATAAPARATRDALAARGFAPSKGGGRVWTARAGRAAAVVVRLPAAGGAPDAPLGTAEFVLVARMTDRGSIGLEYLEPGGGSNGQVELPVKGVVAVPGLSVSLPGLPARAGLFVSGALTRGGSGGAPGTEVRLKLVLSAALGAIKFLEGVTLAEVPLIFLPDEPEL